MTLTKARKLVEIAIKDKKKKIKDFLDPDKSWNQNSDTTREFAKGLSEVLDDDVQCLEAIRKQLPPPSKCRHPKEMHDKCDGQLYCMNCNENL